ncbi:MAG: hypothetical protein U1F43_32555 [Myxococcota bacterium]
MRNASGAADVLTVPAASALNHNVPWSLVLVSNSKSETYGVDRVEVYQDHPPPTPRPTPTSTASPPRAATTARVAAIHPGAFDACDSVDGGDCGGDGDGLTLLSFPKASASPGRAARPRREPVAARAAGDGADVVVDPVFGAAGDIFYRRTLPTFGVSASADPHRAPRSPAALQAERRARRPERRLAHPCARHLAERRQRQHHLLGRPALGRDDGQRIAAEATGAVDNLAEASPYAITFTLGATSRRQRDLGCSA